ncbi:MAG: hypothetical protein M3Y56_09275 [Armatimonadota bacterium]|nr:hypothetical protein [Armatimonadota bacterium]
MYRALLRQFVATHPAKLPDGYSKIAGWSSKIAGWSSKIAGWIQQNCQMDTAKLPDGYSNIARPAVTNCRHPKRMGVEPGSHGALEPEFLWQIWGTIIHSRMRRYEVRQNMGSPTQLQRAR